MTLLRLALQSLWNRKLSSFLTLLSISMSVFLVLGVERIRLGVQDSFENSLSQTDLIVGARGSELQLLLYSVFHMGDAVNNITYDSYQKFASHPATAWTIPLSLGDSHEGYRVVATNENFYKEYRFRGEEQIEFKEGVMAREIFDVVLGASVAEKLKYKLGQSIEISHGLSTLSLQRHSDKPFRVVGILKKTGTPVDQALYITLEGMEAIHIDWKDGAPPRPGENVPAQSIKKEDLQVKQITSFLLRTKNRIATLRLQREISLYPEEPLMSTIPGVALSKLWAMLSYVERALKGIVFCVAFVSLMGLLIVLYSNLESRRREMAIFRSLGMGPFKILALFVSEALSLTLVASLIGVGLLYLVLWGSQSWMLSTFGIFIPIQNLSAMELYSLAALQVAALLLALAPAFKAYRRSLVDALSPRL